MISEANKYVIYTLGCRANQAQSFALKCQMTNDKCSAEGGSAPGGQMVDFGEPADIYIINTCTVTADSDKKSRNAIRRALKLAKKVIVTGCYARLKAKELKELFPTIEITPAFPSLSGSFPMASGVDNNKPRVRENLMIEDGCDNFCAYCIVPYARGELIRRKPIDDIVREANELAAAGVKEIVLTGINLGAWGELSPLLQQLHNVEGLLRVRLSSIEPQYVSDALLNTIAGSPKLCRHLHIPLQSGDDIILKSMNRPYNREDYLALIKKIRKLIPDCGITTDIIVGFPCEGEAEFRNTFDLAKKIGFSRIHIFSFSKRDLTPASKFPDQVDARTIKDRYKRLNSLRDELMTDFAKMYLGKGVEILVEQKGEGLTSNYIRVKFDDPDDSTGKLHRLILKPENITY